MFGQFARVISDERIQVCKHECNVYMEAKHTSVRKSYFFADQIYNFNENGSNSHINAVGKSSLPRKHSGANRWKNYTVVPPPLPQQFICDLNCMLNSNIKDAPNFIRISFLS